MSKINFEELSVSLPKNLKKNKYQEMEVFALRGSRGICLEGRIYLFHGQYQGYEPSDSIYYIDISDETGRTFNLLSTSKDKPRARSQAAIAFIEERKEVYLFGGVDIHLEVLSDIWKFTFNDDLISGKWEYLNRLDYGIWSHTATYHEKTDKIYLIGGLTQYAPGCNYNRNIITYDLKSNDCKYNVSSLIRESHDTVLVNNDLYIIGGVGDHNVISNDILILNTEELSVNIHFVDPRISLQGHCSFLLENKIYIVGGEDNSRQREMNSQILTYDLETKSIIQVDEILARSFFVLTHLKGTKTYFIYGGQIDAITWSNKLIAITIETPENENEIKNLSLYQNFLILSHICLAAGLYYVYKKWK